MKKLIFTAIIMAFVVTSCNQKNKEAEIDSTNKTEETAELYSCPMHPEVQGKKGEACSKCGMELTEPVKTSQNETKESSSQESMKSVASVAISTEGIVKSYLSIKNKLVSDDSNGAAANGKELYAIFNKLDTKSLDANQKKQFIDIADDAKEHAEHIGSNGGKIDHQREHFVLLSKDINDLIKVFGTNQQLYQDYCPMADEGKGAIWISELKDIKNPYYGDEMLTCGSIKMQIN